MGALGASVYALGCRAGLGGTVELNSAEVEGHACDALERAARSGTATTLPERQEAGEVLRERLFPPYRSAWRGGQGR